MPFFSIPNPMFGPAMKLILDITNGNPASVTTTTDHNYISGTIVRLNVPSFFGMNEANHLYAPIIVTGPDTFNIDINTLTFSVFNAPPQGRDQATAFVTPIGEVNQLLTAATKNLL